ncbi:type-F conjugative transfer system pilin assembly protein TrbC [Candidatus Tisiphia endosymbiont of Dascillus cervinus]|uniref:type-F conjugative transfer system pilin assembly protein TrbC n=1 Tax=Candidatus Tisiphia endosymbiont of Dascillus cervinus TaxID=3066253 RepID=UPI00312CB402
MKHFIILTLLGLLLSSFNIAAQSQIYIFVSFSMNDQALKSYYLEAQKIGAILVMRGLKDNSFFETKAKVDKLGISFNIDPNLFKQYQVTMIPAIIVDDGQGLIKKLTGHIPLLKAIEIMEKNIGKNLS